MHHTHIRQTNPINKVSTKIIMLNHTPLHPQHTKPQSTSTITNTYILHLSSINMRFNFSYKIFCQLSPNKPIFV